MLDGARGTVDRRRWLRALGAGSVAALAGCISDDGSEDDAEDEEEVDPRPVDASESATWRTATLEDVTTGEEFSIAGFDRPAVLHTFAIKCAVCGAQHREFDNFYANGNADVEIVDLTIDPNERPDAVREHVEAEGYDWRFSVAPEDVTGSLADDFGREVFASARSPVIVVCPDGGTYELYKVLYADDLESVLADVC